MTHTHQMMVLGPWAKELNPEWVEGSETETEFHNTSQLRQDYPDTPLRIRAISPPGEPQPVDNITPDPNLTTWFVQGSEADLQTIIDDVNYTLMPNTFEEIPVDVIL